MLGEDLPHQRLAPRSEGRVPGSAVRLTTLPLYQPLLFEAIDEVGDPSTRDEDLPLDLAQEHRSLVIERLESAELGAGQVVTGGVCTAVCFDRGVRSCEHDPKLQCRLLFGCSVLQTYPSLLVFNVSVLR